MFQSQSTLRAVALSLSSVAWVSAQDLASMVSGLSSSCQAASGALLSSDYGACINVTGLLPVISSVKNSALKPYAEWVESLCNSAPCSASTVSATLKTVREGCRSDVDKGVPMALKLTSLIMNYDGLRELACLENTANHTRCATTLMENVEKSSNQPVTVTTIEGVLTGGFEALAPSLPKLPKEDLCNDCVHALLSSATAHKLGSDPRASLAGPNATANASTMASSFAACGPGFDDGKIPSTISAPGASNSTGGGSLAATHAANSAGSSLSATSRGCVAVVLLVAALLQLS